MEWSSYLRRRLHACDLHPRLRACDLRPRLRASDHLPLYMRKEWEMIGLEYN